MVNGYHYMGRPDLKCDIWTIMDPVRLDLRYLARNDQNCGGRNDLVMTSFIKFKPIIQNGYVPHIFGYSLRYKQSQCRIHNCPIK